MFKNKSFNPTSMIAALLSVAFCEQAFAQRVAIEEVIVTAQKRSENQQDIPIAISAISAGELASSGITSVEDLAVATPGFQMVRGIANASPFIRGIGADGTSLGNEASVSTYIDGYYVRDMVSAAQAFNNVERVEVLKGPQGTLFGRNATGGVIQTVTKTPSRETEVIVDVFAASYEKFGGSFYGATGITDKLVANLMVAAQRQDGGSVDNKTTGKEAGYDEYTQLFSKWVLSPSDATDLTLTMSWNEKENDVGILETCAKHALCNAGAPARRNNRETFGGVAEYTRSDGYLVGFRVDHSFDPFEFVSLTSYQEYDVKGPNDLDMGSNPILTVIHVGAFTKTLTQEFQLQYEGDAWTSIAGVYFLDDEVGYDPVRVVGTDVGAAGRADVFSYVDTRSYAIFGQADYNLTDATTLTVGLRWSMDEKEINGRSEFGPGGVLGVRRFQDDVDFEEPSGKLGISHRFSPDVMGYASYSRGYKTGGYNSFLVGGALQGVLEPEILDAFALGVKSDFMDDRLRVNAEVFHYEVDNLQLRQTAGTTIVYQNAAVGEILGLELTTVALLTDSLSLTMNYSYLDSSYEDFANCPVTTPSPAAKRGLGGNLIGTGDCTGNNMINTPEHVVGFILDHELPTAVGTFKSSLNYLYNDGYFFQSDNRFDQPSYSVVNASVTWISKDEKYDVMLYGKNLTEAEYTSFGASADFGDYTAVGIFPREYGVRVTASY